MIKYKTYENSRKNKLPTEISKSEFTKFQFVKFKLMIKVYIYVFTCLLYILYKNIESNISERI